MPRFLGQLRCRPSQRSRSSLSAVQVSFCTGSSETEARSRSVHRKPEEATAAKRQARLPLEQRMQNDLEHEFLEFDDFCSDAAASLPPPVRVKTGVARGLNRDTCRMTFHDPIEHSPHSSRVVSSRHEHNGSELVLVAPWRKHLAFTLGSNVGSGDFHDIRHAEPYQLPNLPCARILVRQPAPDKFVIFP